MKNFQSIPDGTFLKAVILANFTQGYVSFGVVTPSKTNMDTQKKHTWKKSIFSKPSFLGYVC